VTEVITKLIKATLLVVLLGALLTVMSVVAAQAQGQRFRTPIANSFKAPSATQQPLYTEYKGVRIGMTADEVRAKLGQAALKADDQDFYVFSDTETAQIAYDSAHKVISISVDYMGGVGAPDYHTVVGGNIEVKPDGAIYKLVRYEQFGVWVSYNRPPGNPFVTVTITIQKILNKQKN
jgi:hypothetical protein